MISADGSWFSVLTVMLFGLLIFLRTRYPKASKVSETAVLAVTSVLFFSLCHLFLRP